MSMLWFRLEILRFCAKINCTIDFKIMDIFSPKIGRNRQKVLKTLTPGLGYMVINRVLRLVPTWILIFRNPLIYVPILKRGICSGCWRPIYTNYDCRAVSLEAARTTQIGLVTIWSQSNVQHVCVNRPYTCRNSTGKTLINRVARFFLVHDT
jgi:hypothetical protein